MVTTNTDADPRPALVLVTALILSAAIGVLVVDALLTGRELRRAARKLRDVPTPPAHTEN